MTAKRDPKGRNPSQKDPRDFLPLKPDLFQVLLALAGQNLHGYGIVKEVETNTGGQIRLAPSPLYRRLKRLMDEGIVEEAEFSSINDSEDERRRYYRITQLGRAVVQAEARRLMELAGDARVKALASESEAPGRA